MVQLITWLLVSNMIIPIELFHKDLHGRIHDTNPVDYPQLDIDTKREGQAVEIRKKYAEMMDQIVSPYQKEERETWFTQLQEADAWMADNNYQPPMLTVIAKNRGITVAEMVAKVKENDRLFRAGVGYLLGLQQAELDALYRGDKDV